MDGAEALLVIVRLSLCGRWHFIPAMVILQLHQMEHLAGCVVDMLLVDNSIWIEKVQTSEYVSKFPDVAWPVIVERHVSSVLGEFQV